MTGQSEGVIQVMSTTQGGRERNQAWEKDVILHNGGVGQDQLFLKKNMVEQGKEQKVDEEQSMKSQVVPYILFDFSMGSIKDLQ